MTLHRRQSRASATLAALAAAVLFASPGRAESLVTARSLVDRSGLAFVSTDAFCDLHCKPWRADRELSECDAVLCASHRRRLAQDVADQVASTSKLSVLRCGDSSSASQLNFDIDAATPSVEALRGFHSAFFQAFEELITSENASYEACQLQWLQQDLLPNATADDTTSTSTTGARPTLLRIDPKTEQRACVAEIQTIWTSDDESVTPFLSRLDQSSASATVLLVHVNGSVAQQLSTLACVDSVTELPSILKLLPFARSAAQINSGTATPKMWLRVLEGATPQTVFNRLQAKMQSSYGITNVYEMPDRADLYPRGVFIKSLEQLELWSHAVALAAADGDIEWVDAKSEVSMHSLRRTRNDADLSRRRLDDYVADLVGVTQAQQRGINGDNVVVGITDTGLYIDHDQFDQASRNIYDRLDRTARKVIYYNTWADQYDQGEEITCGHGTHVSGILAGSSFSGNSRNLGVAPNAKIAFMDIASQPSSCAGQKGCEVDLTTPGDASDLLQSQITAGARIFSFSWGTGGSDYSYQARDLDAFVYQNPEVLIVIAAGNNGESTANGQGTISSPAGAKNAITVGASLNSAQSFGNFACSVYNPGSVASFSSSGPTTDGRMKPDVVAPGMALVSSRSEAPGSTTKTSQTCSLQGSSMATPVVGGIAVLLYQWLRDGYWKAGTADPQYAMSSIPAALLKALIIHSGSSLQRRLARVSSGQATCGTLQSSAVALSYPDVYQGYGRPNMSSIADLSGVESKLFFLPNSTAGSQPSVAHGREVRISFTVPRGVDLRATLVWTDPAGSIRATTVLQHDLDLSVQIRNTTAVFYPLTANNATNRDERNNVEMVQVSYQQLLDAVNARGNASALLGPSGEIVVDAIIFGRSVLLARSQAFAFVASSSVIGTTIGSSGSNTEVDNGGGIGDKSDWDGRFDTWNSGSSLSAWAIAGISVGALLLVVLIISCVCCRKRRTARRNDDTTYHLYGAPAIANRSSIGACPYCSFSTPDPVAMVNHVENMHPGGGVAFNGAAVPPGPLFDPYNQQASVNRLSVGTCPYCSFSTPDPVVMVNHVENMHPSGGVVVNGPAAGTFGVPLADSAGGTSPASHYPVAQDHQRSDASAQPQPNAQSYQQCPFCTYESSDPVVLVNHVENIHRGQRMI